jgi:hypothetical protein
MDRIEWLRSKAAVVNVDDSPGHGRLIDIMEDGLTMQILKEQPEQKQILDKMNQTMSAIP